MTFASLSRCSRLNSRIDSVMLAYIIQTLRQISLLNRSVHPMILSPEAATAPDSLADEPTRFVAPGVLSRSPCDRFVDGESPTSAARSRFPPEGFQ